MPPKAPQHKNSPAWKIVVSVLIVAPLAVVTCGLSLMAVIMALGALTGTAPTAGVLLLYLVGLAGWYLYSLIASLWFDRRGASIVLGLVVGLIFLSIVIFNIADDTLGRVRSNITWTAKQYGETYGLGSVGLAGWGLTLFLIRRASQSTANVSQ
jgi:hypothetical protein